MMLSRDTLAKGETVAREKRTGAHPTHTTHNKTTPSFEPVTVPFYRGRGIYALN